MSEKPPLVFEDDSKTLVFEDIEPVLVFADEEPVLVFDQTQDIQEGFPYTFPYNLS